MVTCGYQGNTVSFQLVRVFFHIGEQGFETRNYGIMSYTVKSWLCEAQVSSCIIVSKSFGVEEPITDSVVSERGTETEAFSLPAFSGG